MKRKLLSIVLAFCLTLTLLPTATLAAGSYADTNGHWAEAAIERWSGYGILQGADGKFSPDGTLTRAQMATILSRLLALPEASSYGFTDVAAGDWFADAIDRCAAAGIMQGTGGKAEPNAPITREQAMVMLCRALGIDAVAANLSGYPDGAQVSAYAAGYVAALVQMGIVKGDANGKLNPAGNITRAEIVTIIDRLITVYANVDGAVINAANGGTVLVTAKNVSIANAPEGTKVIAAKGADGLSVNGKPIPAGQTYVVPKTTTGSGSGSSGGSDMPSHSHTWGAWVTTKEPTCAETGTKTRTCTVCGQTETAAIDKLAHRAGAAATCTDAQVCTVCGQVIAPATGHTWVVSGTETKCDTTVTTYTCSACDATKTETAAGGSHTEVAVAAAAATCTTVGTTAGTKCSVCHAVLSGCKTVPALGHDFAETWTSNGENHWHACTRCDARSAEAAHVYERTTTDWTSAELKTGMTCTVCGYFEDLSAQGIYYVANAADLKAFADKVNGGTSFAGKTVKLTADIDLKDVEWTPIGNVISYPTTTFKGTFDGQEHTISNMTVNDETAGCASAGFFGSITGKVKNVNFDNATVTSTHYAGVVVGYSSTNVGMEISNCHVANSSVTSVTELKADGNHDNGDKAGGIIGYCVSGDTVTGCSVTNTTIKAYRDIGGIVGSALGGANTKVNITNNKVENVTLIQDSTNGYGESTDTSTIAAIAGRFNELTDTTGSTATGVTYVVGSSKALERVIALDEENLSIVLGADVTVDTKPHVQKPFGGASTKTLTIDGREKYKLTFINTNSDWNNIVLGNADATLILKNMTIDNSGYNADNKGTWNSHDITFNCKVELENVKADNAIALERDAKLTNVTIKDPNCGGDVYVLWIRANGQTVELNNCVINGKSDVGKKNRAIKISDQYVSDPKSVTLKMMSFTISSDKYAAVYVGSKGGANITYEAPYNITDVKTGEMVAIDDDYAATSGPVYVNGVRLYGRTAVSDGLYEAFDPQANTSWYEVENAAGLRTFAANVSAETSYAGKTIKLTADIDLAGENWTPINAGDRLNRSTIDGDGHTIRNMTVRSCTNSMGYGAGFIGDTRSAVTIKNITFDGADVAFSSTEAYFGNIGGIVMGYTYGTTLFENVTVTNSSIWGFGKIGCLLGMGADPGVSVTFKDCVSKDNTIRAAYNIGGLAGLIQRANGKDNGSVENCTVENITVIFEDDAAYQDISGNVHFTVNDKKNGGDASREISGKYWIYNKYFWGGYADYYVSYGDSSYDAPVDGYGYPIANSEYPVNK